MITNIEDLPSAVQLEIKAKRASIADWPAGSSATPSAWMAYYAILSPVAREWLVSNLLSLAQTGSACIEADHAGDSQASMNQLREVVTLHNARVDEVASLRRQLAALTRTLSGETEIAAPTPPAPAGESEAELRDCGDELVELEGSTPFPPDRRLYVVRTPPSAD